MLKLELINESIFLFACYQMLFYTSVLPRDDPYAPEKIGMCTIITISSLAGFTGLIILFSICKQIYLRLKLVNTQSQQQKVKNEKATEETNIEASKDDHIEELIEEPVLLQNTLKGQKTKPGMTKKA